MDLQLNPVQRRVLGVLIEKSMTQPEYYPMTHAALAAGCNQRSNRDPVMNVTEADVGKAIWELQGKGIVSQAEPGRGSRVNRFRHEAETKLGWSGRDRAIMAELLLRGPQTPGELRTRASRMIALESVVYVGELLAELAKRDPPLVRELARGPGQQASRWSHLMYLDDEPLPVVGPGVALTTTLAPTHESAPLTPDRAEAIEERLTAVEQALSDLREELRTLKGA